MFLTVIAQSRKHQPEGKGGMMNVRREGREWKREGGRKELKFFFLYAILARGEEGKSDCFRTYESPSGRGEGEIKNGGKIVGG